MSLFSTPSSPAGFSHYPRHYPSAGDFQHLTAIVTGQHTFAPRQSCPSNHIKLHACYGGAHAVQANKFSLRFRSVSCSSLQMRTEPFRRAVVRLDVPVKLSSNQEV